MSTLPLPGGHNEALTSKRGWRRAARLLLQPTFAGLLPAPFHSCAPPPPGKETGLRQRGHRGGRGKEGKATLGWPGRIQGGSGSTSPIPTTGRGLGSATEPALPLLAATRPFAPSAAELPGAAAAPPGRGPPHPASAPARRCSRPYRSALSRPSTPYFFSPCRTWARSPLAAARCSLPRSFCRSS